MRFLFEIVPLSLPLTYFVHLWRWNFKSVSMYSPVEWFPRIFSSALDGR